MNLDILEHNLRIHCGIPPDMPLVVGLSGGPDSQCLVHALVRLGQPLVTAHLDHGLRPGSAKEALAASAFARKLGQRCVSEQRDVGKLAEIARLSIEAAARRARYEFLFRVARQAGAGAVAVAHTADDLVETVLMHLLRGSGLRGLRGLVYRSDEHDWDDHRPLIRPLLGAWREDVERYCQENALEPVLDESNTDVTFLRNRIRHELLPLLETYNPKVRQALLRMARSLDGDWETLQAFSNEALVLCLKEEGEGFLALSLPTLQEMEPGEQRRVLRAALGRLLPGLPDLGFDCIEQLSGFIAVPPVSGQASLTKELCLRIDGNSLFLARPDSLPGTGSGPQVDGSVVLQLPVPGQIELGGDWRMTAEHISMTEAVRQRHQSSGDPWQAWLDAGVLEIPMQVRPRQAGDRFKPFGMNGRSTSLKEFYINVKLPRRMRQSWPVVFSNEDPAWLPGYRVGHAYRLRPETEWVIHLHLFRQ